MHTILFSHSACLNHDTGQYHPECADRLRAVMQALEAEEFMFLDRRDAPRAEREVIARVHPMGYVDWVLEQIPAEGHAALDGDTHISPGSGEAALRAAGAVVAAVDAVMAGQARNAFCAVRPPGHHAEPARAMGFCMFNNIAIGAAHARAAYGLERVAVMDFDVHHGNGTQAMFENDAGLMYLSTHQGHFYPGTGLASEHGVADNIVNAPLAALSGSAEFRAAFDETILPALERFRPELLLISAGFDAHAADPLAQLRLTEADFAWATRQLMQVAERHAKGRVVSALEGGYDLHALAACARVHVLELMEG